MSAASFTSFSMSAGLRRSTTWAVASIWWVERRRSASAFQLIAAAGGEAEVAAFLRESFGRGRANTFGGAGDQDALAAQMQIHGNTRSVRGMSEKVGEIGRR